MYCPTWYLEFLLYTETSETSLIYFYIQNTVIAVHLKSINMINFGAFPGTFLFNLLNFLLLSC